MVEADPVSAAVQLLMTTEDAEDRWQGTATELLTKLELLAGERVANSKHWPGSGSALSGRLTRIATPLRQHGIEISRDQRGHDRTRIITITADPNLKVPHKVSAPSATVSDPGRKGWKHNEVKDEDGADGDYRTFPFASATPSAPSARKPFVYQPNQEARYNRAIEARRLVNRRRGKD